LLVVNSKVRSYVARYVDFNHLHTCLLHGRKIYITYFILLTPLHLGN
jgi:hypothetical protein